MRDAQESRGLGDVYKRQVLLLEGEGHCLCVEARAAARVLQEHEGEEPGDLGLAGHQLRERARHADRLVGDARVSHHRVALVEGQVQHLSLIHI